MQIYDIAAALMGIAALALVLHYALAPTRAAVHVHRNPFASAHMCRAAGSDPT
jgi:hypothetical protein